MEKSPRLLVVDDDAQKRFLIIHHLKRSIPGAAVFECGSGAEAIAHMEHHPIHAVVTDHNMVPVNGLELIAWVREHRGNLPVVMVTGHPTIEEKALAAGATRVMSTAEFQKVGDVLRELIQTTGD